MDEEQLIAALRQRDPAAVENLLDAYGDRLLRSAVVLCGNETEAQDLVQDTLVQAIRSIRRFRGQSSIYTWLHAILLNLSRHYHRDRRRIIYDEQLARDEEFPGEESPCQLDAGATSTLWEALKQLSTEHREALVLRYYEDMKIREIAMQLGLSPGTVKSRLHYAIAEMQKLLPGEMNLFGGGGTKEMKQ